MNHVRSTCRVGAALLTLTSLAVAWSCGGKVGDGGDVGGNPDASTSGDGSANDDAGVSDGGSFDGAPGSDASTGFSDAGLIDLTGDDAAACAKRPGTDCASPEEAVYKGYLACTDGGSSCSGIRARFDSAGCATGFTVGSGATSPLTACMRAVLDRERLTCAQSATVDIIPCTK